MSDLIKVILLGILEGVTEFLPVSSTGHLFLAQTWLGIELKDGPAAAFWKAFGIVIQIGAIFAVIIYFRARILDLLLGRRPAEVPEVETERAARLQAFPVVMAAGASPGNGDRVSHEPPSRGSPARQVDLGGIPAYNRYRGLFVVAVGTLPIYATGLFVGKIADRLEEHPLAIALALLIGGIIMFVIEKLVVRTTTHRLEDMTWKQALAVGCTQILAALFPGTSRSAATIMPGLVAGLSRPVATEFSFFLAIPAMFAACGYKLLKWLKENHPNSDQLLLMAIGTVVSFLVAWVVIAGFMAYIRRHNFIGFAVYRIAFSLFVLGWIFLGHHHR